MATFGLSNISSMARSPAANTVTPMFEIRTGPTDYAVIQEFETAFNIPGAGAAAFSSFAFGIPLTRGSGVIGSQSLIEIDDLNSPCGVTVAFAWVVPPTPPTAYQRRWDFSLPAAAAGSTYIFEGRFKRGFKLLPNASAVIWCITTTINVGTTVELTGLRIES